MGKVTLAIVDDHRMLLGALTQWIRSATDDLELVAAVATWPELIGHEAFPMEVVLLDVDLKDNIPVAVKIATLNSAGVKTVLMSTYSEPTIIRDALAAGALGYLVKSEDAVMIVEAIRSASIGEVFVSAELDLALGADPEIDGPKLSGQERQVMALYVTGQPLKAVAFQMGITEETAKGYLKRVREKYRAHGIDVGNKVALRMQAIQDGMLVGPDVPPTEL